MKLYLSIWGTGPLASQEWLIFLVNVISEMIKVIIIHQNCFQFCLALAVFDLLEWFMAWTHNISQGTAVTMHLFLLVTGSNKCFASYFFWLVWSSFPLFDLFLSFLQSKAHWKIEMRIWRANDQTNWLGRRGSCCQYWNQTGTGVECGLPFQQVYGLCKSATAANLLYYAVSFCKVHYMSDLLFAWRRSTYFWKWNMTLRFLPFYDFYENCEIGFKSNISL